MKSNTVAIFIFLALCISTFAFKSSSKILKNSRFISMISGGRRPLMGGNWKLNPPSVIKATALATEVAKLTKDVTDVDIVVFPPHPFLVPVYSKIEATNVQLGGQNCYFQDEGAYTGAVSTCMLRDVLKEGLKPVLCFGESQEEYEAGLNHEVCAIQLMKDLKEVSAEEMKDVILAYEPVWAIGTGLVCPPSVAQEVHQFVRGLIEKKYGAAVASKTIIQYGGSVKPDNVKELMACPDIDGCLVGGASLTPDSFAKIVKFKDQK